MLGKSSFQFLQSGLPSKLIRHENVASENALQKRGNLKTPALRFSVNGKRFSRR